MDLTTAVTLFDLISSIQCIQAQEARTVRSVPPVLRYESFKMIRECDDSVITELTSDL